MKHTVSIDIETISDILFWGISLDNFKPYVIVIGRRGIGKSVFIEGMKKYDKRHYFEEQYLHAIPRKFLLEADAIIEIKNVRIPLLPKKEDDHGCGETYTRCQDPRD